MASHQYYVYVAVKIKCYEPNLFCTNDLLNILGPAIEFYKKAFDALDV